MCVCGGGGGGGGGGGVVWLEGECVGLGVARGGGRVGWWDVHGKCGAHGNRESFGTLWVGLGSGLSLRRMICNSCSLAHAVKSTRISSGLLASKLVSYGSCCSASEVSYLTWSPDCCYAWIHTFFR